MSRDEQISTLEQRTHSLETELAHSEELFRLLVDSVRDYAIFMLDTRGYVATWNVGAERIKGYRPSEIIGRNFSVFYPEDDRRSERCAMELEVAAREGRFEDEGWRIRKDGSRFWANVVISPVRNRSGALIGYAKVTRDLTQRRRTEDAQQARLEAEERLRLLVESVRDYAIFMLDPDGTVATWNPGAQRIKGYTPSEIIGSHFSRFYPPEVAATGICELELEVAAREGRFEDEGWRVRKDGSTFWANVVISAVRDHDGKLVGFSKVTRDLTERKRAEEERAARLAAEQASRTKDEFLAMLGHELRNPLAPIVTALDLMKLRGDQGVSREQEVIERQVRHMMELVDDLLDVSRVTKGKLELKRRHLDLRGVLAKAVEIASPLLEQRDQHFELTLPSREVVVDGDEARLTQIFTNLLTNAAKYTEPGGRISAGVRTLNGDVIVEVRDNGVGIDPELLPRVFELFVQGRQGTDRAAGGLGIGLTLVRMLTLLHGGAVEARSAGRGQGSTFTVRLPIVSAAEPEQPTRSKANPLQPVATPSRILLVDDNQDALELLAEALRAVGHDVRTASDPAAALAALRDFSPEVAILDIGLPVMDGYELAARIRDALTRAPRLFALTGYGQEHDRDRALAAGFAAHFVKPVDILGLLAAIAG